MGEVIKLVRHGESFANIGTVRGQDVGDHRIELTPRGHEQAREAGRRLGAEFIRSALVYTSPFERARQTLAGLLEGAGLQGDQVRVYEDPRLREVEHGYTDVRAQEALRRTHGWFYYRFEGGESPADCYDRTAGFLESMMRQKDRKKSSQVLIVTHGLTVRCFAMRFLHLRVEDFDRMLNPANCDIITIAKNGALREPQFSSGRWGVEGMRLRQDDPEGTA